MDSATSAAYDYTINSMKILMIRVHRESIASLQLHLHLHRFSLASFAWCCKESLTRHYLQEIPTYPLGARPPWLRSPWRWSRRSEREARGPSCRLVTVKKKKSC